MEGAPVRVIIDTDPAMGVLGGDPEDAFAVMLALNSPELDVAGITAVNGNVPVRLAHANAHHLLSLLGKDTMPLSAGPDRPLMPHRADQRRWQAAKLGLPRLISAPAEPQPVRAPQQIARQLIASPEPTTILAIGPLTNLALALLLEPGIVDRVERVVIMGGSGRIGGNVTPAAEFNFWCDPEAAAIVAAAGWPITLVTLEVCHQTRLTRTELEQAPMVTPVGRFARAACEPWLDSPEHDADRGFPLFDSLAAAVLLQPDIVKSRPAAVEVDTTAGPSAGADVIWFDHDVHGDPLSETNMDVAVEVDVERFQALFARRVLDRL